MTNRPFLPIQTRWNISLDKMWEKRSPGAVGRRRVLAFSLALGLILPVYQMAFAVDTNQAAENKASNPTLPLAQPVEATPQPQAQPGQNETAQPSPPAAPVVISPKPTALQTKQPTKTNTSVAKQASKPAKTPSKAGAAFKKTTISGKPATAKKPAQSLIKGVQQPSIWIYQGRESSAEQLKAITQVLLDGNISHQGVGLTELSTVKSGYLILPLGKHLDLAELEAFTQYVASGGKLVLLPPNDISDPSVQQLFSNLQIPVDTVSFASQSLDLKWGQASASAKNKAPAGLQGSIPVGSQLLSLKPGARVKVLAMWGEDFPAVIQSAGGTLFLNWQWGEELTPEANLAALSELTGVSVSKLPKPTLSEQTFGFLQPQAANDLANMTLTQEQYERQQQTLADYDTQVYDAIETALMLDISLPLKIIQQHVFAAGFDRTRFEFLYDQGQYGEAQQSFRDARNHLEKAMTLTSSSPRVEGRTIWLDRGTIVDSGSPVGLKKVFEKLRRAGINVIYFETVNAGFSVYPSEITRQNPLVDPSWDPLEVAVREAHQMGMELHAWVWCFAAGNKRHNPIIGKPLNYPGPMLEDKQLMSEALRGPGGNLLPAGKQYEFWLSPASPRARQFLSDLYAEIITKYDVDGLHLDYIRYPFQKPGNLMGFDPVSRARFYQSTGLSLDHLNEHTYRVWVAWKTYQISSFVKELSERLKSAKPQLKISAAVFPLPRASRIVAIQQDWETWVENGWVDILSPMSYTTSPKALQQVFESVETAAKKRALIYPGIAINKLTSDQLLRQVDALREKGALGSTIFAMAHLDDVKINALQSGPYKELAVQSPHKDPVGATISIANDYRDKFNRLKRLQELNSLSADQLNTLQQHLSAFQTNLTNLQSPKIASQSQTLGNTAQMTLASAKSNLSALSDATNLWLGTEKAIHPFRYQYFNELMLRLEQMTNYLSAYYKPKKDDNLQAHFLMVLEEEKALVQAEELARLQREALVKQKAAALVQAKAHGKTTPDLKTANKPTIIEKTAAKAAPKNANPQAGTLSVETIQLELSKPTTMLQKTGGPALNSPEAMLPKAPPEPKTVEASLQGTKTQGAKTTLPGIQPLPKTTSVKPSIPGQQTTNPNIPVNTNTKLRVEPPQSSASENTSPLLLAPPTNPAPADGDLLPTQKPTDASSATPNIPLNNDKPVLPKPLN